MANRFTRREMLGGTMKAGLAGGALAVGSGSLLAACTPGDASASATDVISPTGIHQPGIVTPVTAHLAYAALDVTTNRPTNIIELLQHWSAAIVEMTAGRPFGAVAPGDERKPPGDTGEALGARPARLTVTVGFGRSLFVQSNGRDRFGFGAYLPKPLIDLPEFPHDALDPARCGGDLSLQVSADDAQTVFHAVHDLIRLAHGTAKVRWMQSGFGRASTTTPGAPTPRNLMGFKDGTNNIKADDRAALRDHVWVGFDDRPEWMRNGAYAVVRRIRMRIEQWDASSLKEQQETIGRTKLEGAPIGTQHEHDTVELSKVPAKAHIAVAAPANNGGVRILRRGYNYAEGLDGASGKLDAGLFFIAYQRDLRRQFVPLQHRLAAHDALNEYIEHVGSGVFAVPPGFAPGGFAGDSLFG